MSSLMNTIKNLYKKEDVAPIVEQDDTLEKEEMALTQLYFVKYAAEEIIEYIEEYDGDIEEWYQNKLSKVHSDMESLHSFIEGEKRRLEMEDDEDEGEEIEEEVELDEAAHKVSVTVSDPNHPMVTKRKEKMEKRVIVNADDKNHAVVKAKEFYKKKGFTVHDANYHSPQGKSTMETEEVKVGDKVHVGLMQKGGSGMRGTVHKIDGDTVHVNVGTGKFGDRIVKGFMKNVTKEENTPPFTSDKKKPPIATPGKTGYGPSAAKHLAKTSLKKQMDKNKTVKEEVEEITESHFNVGQRVECIASGMKGTVTKLDDPQTGKYYTVKQDSGKVMKYAPDELKPIIEKEEQIESIEDTIKKVVMGEKLTPKQKELDVDKDGDIGADDLADLRAGKHKKKDEKISGGKEQIVLNPKLNEEEMTDAEMKKREEIVKSLKKRTQEFKDRYGDRWKDVMYATATKIAMK